MAETPAQTPGQLLQALLELRERVQSDEAMIREVETRKRRKRPLLKASTDAEEDHIITTTTISLGDVPGLPAAAATEGLQYATATAATASTTTNHTVSTLVTSVLQNSKVEILRDRIRFLIKRRLSKGVHGGQQRENAAGQILLPCVHTEFTALFPNRPSSFTLNGPDILGYLNDRLGQNWNLFLDGLGAGFMVSTSPQTPVFVCHTHRWMRDYSNGGDGATLVCGFLRINFTIIRSDQPVVESLVPA